MNPAPEHTATAPDTATKAKPYVCLTCTRPFARLEHLKRHERSHTKEKPFCCDQAGDIIGCGRRFARRDLLLRHQQKIHLFPNTSKRRRLSTVSQISSQSQQQEPQGAREQFTISIPNLDDLTNFENGTVNPSSICSASPPASAATLGIQHFVEPSMLAPAPSSFTTSNDFTFATAKLFPLDLMHQESDAASTNWQMPELSQSASSPTSTASSRYSPHPMSGSLGQLSALEHAGTDSELFQPDFFTSNGAYVQHFSQQHQRRLGRPASTNQVQNQAFMQSQLFLESQMDQMHPSSGLTKHMSNEEFANFSFAGGEQAYCNGFRPNDLYSPLAYVETF
ncbi:protein of unknown function [Taphrina deformans PYCC 5710]|uniref:C2H2-type domain-containing protein n=1 Tax=Taphrina deformans (strain PYCC 5710 / ATCC 11124 / CBS 356.35 / IMI 108563 / JCM 9778 / NBRC 8474) TaxID=1097556 RepID=R4XMJ4_TAPDE|nr:protein of unknown function [Taphrina deformans PYCC 5710]|eukprot:CCG84530.1 protein of unknown function [Taphrina deformans PYCC 5710]